MKENPLKKFQGKWIVRTQAVKRSQCTDRSFMMNPIKIVSVEPQHAIYHREGCENRSILPADYQDEHWEEVGSSYFDVKHAAAKAQ